MRQMLGAFALLGLACVATGCVSYKQDVATIASFGGRVTPTSGSYPFIPPMEAIDFSPERRLLDDDDFAAVLPSIKRLAPYRLFISGQRISDRSVPLINEIPHLHIVAAEGTDITPEGHAHIRPQGDAMERWFEGPTE